jgi:hypothetical protein
MSALDTAKEFVRIGSTAGLSKDVVDLLEKKSSLLAEQVTALERENTQLKLENGQLRQQLQHLRPPSDSLDGDTRKVLQLFFEAGRELTIGQVAGHLGFQASVAEFHFDELVRRRFIDQSGVGYDNASCRYELMPEGRRYVMTHRT